MWMTPVWLLSLGIALGFLLSILMIVKLIVLQKVPFFNSLAENRSRLHLFGLGLAAIYLAMFLGVYYWRYKTLAFDSNLILALVFAIPICLMIGYAALILVSRRMTGELGSLCNEGFLWWVNRIGVAFTIFAVLGFVSGSMNIAGVAKIVDDPWVIMHSIGRITAAGTSKYQITVPPSDPNHTGDPLAVKFDGAELQTIVIKSDQRLEVSTEPITADLKTFKIYSIDASPEGIGISRQAARVQEQQYDSLYINNLGVDDANINISIATAPIITEVGIVPVTAFLVVMVYLMYLVLAALAPKVAAIAHSTFKTEVSQPLYLLVMVIGLVFVVVSLLIPYYTFGEDIKLYKDSGLTLIRIVAIFTAIWAASKSVAEEIEGRTALTVLSKPVGRRQFILGKFTGISLSIMLMFLILGLWFVIFTAYKPIYDGRENSSRIEEWSICFNEAMSLVPGLVLYFLEVIIFVAISVAISTRLGILPNFLICFSIYVLGHLTPQFLQSNLSAFEPVVAFGNLLAVIFPVLDHFDAETAINNSQLVPLDYLAWAVIYTAIYGTIAALLALVFFEDRDLA